MKTLLKVLAILVLLFIAIQVVPYRPKNGPVTGAIAAPAPVQSILVRACYDCHSQEAVIPAYGKIAPLSWWLAHEIGEGREHLDFSSWNALKPEKKMKRLADLSEEVGDREMPPKPYLRMHPEARLSAADIALLASWAEQEKKNLATVKK